MNHASRILNLLLDARITSEEALNRLQEEVVFTIENGELNIIQNQILDEPVIVFPHHVFSRIKSCIEGLMDTSELTYWANLVTTLDGYERPPSDSKQPDDYYDVMWHVLQCLSTPSIDGELTDTQLNQYLSELKQQYVDLE